MVATPALDNPPSGSCLKSRVLRTRPDGSLARVLVRCTARLLKLLGPTAMLEDAAVSEDDWYANLLWLDRRKCLLLVHAGTLFPIFAVNLRKPQLTKLGPFFTGLVVDELAREGLPDDTFGALSPADVRVARTASRSVLGHMNDMAHLCEQAVAVDGGLDWVDVADLNRLLRRGLHNHDGYIVPIEQATEWATSGPRGDV